MSRWLYAKLFVLEQNADWAMDAVLLSVVRRCVERCIAERSIDRYFFLRYDDAGAFHVRFRARLSSADDFPAVDSVLRGLLRSLPASVCVGLEYLDYEPEVLKHGGLAGMDISERQFCESSKFAIDCVSSTSERVGRLFLSTWSLKTFAGLAVAGASERAFWVRAYREYWSHVLKGTLGVARVAPSASVRSRRALSAWLARPDPLRDSSEELSRSGAAWAMSLRGDLAVVSNLTNSGELTVGAPALWLNWIHTFNNRIGVPLWDEITVADLWLSTQAP